MNASWKALAQAVRHLHRKTRFPDSAWTGDRNQPHILTQQKFLRGSNFFLSPHKPSPLHGNIGWAWLRLLNLFLREAIAYRCKFVRQLAGRGVALIRLLLQAPLDSPTQRSGRFGVLHSDWFRLFPENCHHRFRYRVPLKGPLSAHHLVEHQAE